MSDIERTPQQGYEYVINSPRAWRETAGNLLSASDLIARECRLDEDPTDENVTQATQTGRLIGPLLVLRASAIECLLKGNYVRRVGPIIKDGSYASPVRRGKNHDLLALAEAACVAVSEEDAELLRALSDWVSHGKSPLQLTWDEHFFGRFGVAPAWGAEREGVFRGLVARLIGELRD